MLQQAYYYLRLFAVKYRRQIAAPLGQNPTYTRVEEQLGLHPCFHQGDAFITAFITGPFQAHITRSRQEKPFILGNQRRLNEGLPIRVCAKSQLSTLPAPPGDDTEILDIAQISKYIRASEQGSPLRVPANPMTTAPHQVSQSVWETIQMARFNSNLTAEELRALEARFDTLTDEHNRDYGEITTDTRIGIHYLQQHLHGLATQARQFSATVNQ